MSERFRAILIDKSDKTEKGQAFRFAELTESRPHGRAMSPSPSSTRRVNYKDGLAITGKAPIVRRLPLIPGIDFAGVVDTLRRIADFKAGDRVVLNGWGVGETPSWRLCRSGPGQGRLAGRRCRTTLDQPQAMAIGTAGYTAMLVRDGARGARRDARRAATSWSPARPAASARSRSPCWPSSAIASSPRPAGRRGADYLQARSAPPRSSTAANLPAPVKPLAKERWAGAVDAVGSTTLANVLSQTTTAARSRPAALPRAWTCRPRWCPSSCAASRSPASTR